MRRRGGVGGSSRNDYQPPEEFREFKCRGCPTKLRSCGKIFSHPDSRCKVGPYCQNCQKKLPKLETKLNLIKTKLTKWTSLISKN